MDKGTGRGPQLVGSWGGSAWASLVQSCLRLHMGLSRRWICSRIRREAGTVARGSQELLRVRVQRLPPRTWGSMQLQLGRLPRLSTSCFPPGTQVRGIWLMEMSCGFGTDLAA